MNNTTSTSSETVSLLEKLEKHLKSNNYKLQPFTNHPLVKQNEYNKKLYLEMLSFVFYATSNITDAAKFHLQRLIHSILSEEDPLDFLRKGMLTDEDQLNKFIKEIAPLDLKYCFLVDSLVLLHLSDSIDQSQYQFFATLSQHLKISYDEVQILAEFSKSILEQNTELYNQIMSSDKAHFYESLLLYYFDDYVHDKNIISSKYINVSKNEHAEIDQLIRNIPGKKLHFSAQSVILDNVTIDMKKYKCIFNNCKEVLIKNCTFLGHKSELFILKCDSVVFENCTFKDYSSRVINLEYINSIKLINCHFSNCQYIYSDYSGDWSDLGAIIYSPLSSTINSVYLDSCSFEDCGGINQANYYRSSILSNCKARVANSNFVNCWHFNDLQNIDPDSAQRTLFTIDSTQKNNKFINTAKFN